MGTRLINEIVSHLHSLPYTLQRKVLEFTRALVRSVPRGVPGNQLLRFAGTIPRDDVMRMRRAIEEGCERIDGSQW